MADSNVRSIDASAVSWAVERALRYAVATTAVALVFAGLSGGEDAERLATTAYLAAFFTVVMLVLRRYLPKPPDASPKARALFPLVFGFSVVVAILLATAASLASEPSAEGLLVGACIVTIAFAALTRSGSIAAAGFALVRGGTIAATLRCLGVAVVATLALAAVLPTAEAGDFATLAYRVVFAAAVALAVALLAPTAAGRFAVQSFEDGVAFVQNMGSWNLTAGATYAALAAGAALLAASVAPHDYAEGLAIFAYCALAFAAVAIAMRWRLQLSGYSQASPARLIPGTPLRFRDVPTYLVANVSGAKFWDFSRASQWSAGTAAAALLAASVLSAERAAPFVSAGYFALIFAAVTMALQLWIELDAGPRRIPNAGRRAGLPFAAGSAVLAVLAALAASNPIAAKAVVLLCLTWILIAIGKRFAVAP